MEHRDQPNKKQQPDRFIACRVFVSLPLEGKVGNSLANWSDEVETLLLQFTIGQRIDM